MVSGSPLSNTIAAASGSTQMLNSAIGVLLPRPVEPPMITISRIFSRTSGRCSSSAAMLVSGPVGHERHRLVGGQQRVGDQA